MAIVEKNIVIQGLKGKLGKLLVFRQRRGKTIVSAAPRKTNKPPSEAQEIRREKFRHAVAYAQGVLQNPSIKALYTARLGAHQSVYHAALSDYLHAPQIIEIDVQSYMGKEGDRLYIQVTDKGIIARVSVAFYLPDGSLTEEGDAIYEEQGTGWIYTARHHIERWEDLTVAVRATDLPGNQSARKVSLKENI